MRIDGAIFDLDGTLLDSMFIWDTIGEAYLRARGIEPHDNLNERFKTMSLYQAVCHYRSEYGLTDSAEKIMAEVNQMIERLYFEKVQPKPGVLHFLASLKKSGVKMCIATATDLYLVERALARCGILAYFGEIFTCTSVGHGKDEPDIFLSALRYLGTAQEYTWVFEDALHAARTAKAAGFPVAAVYDKSEANPEELKNLADLYVRSLADINMAE